MVLSSSYRHKQVEDHKQIAAGVGDVLQEAGKTIGQLNDHPGEVVLAKAAEIVQAYNDAGGGAEGVVRGANRINPLFLGPDALAKNTVAMFAAARSGDARSFGKNATPLAIFFGTLSQPASAAGTSTPVAISANGHLAASADAGAKVVAAGNPGLAAAGILLSSSSSSGGDPVPSVREQRLKELSKDPAKGDKITPQSRREAEVGLDLEEQGKLHGIKRDPTGAAEFIDANGVSWDVKGFVSGDMKGGFKLAESALKIERELLVGENVIVDTARMSAQDISALKAEALTKKWGSQVMFYPQQ